MVGDFFEMEGWDTYYLGANTPANTITEAIEEYNADIVGLSIAMPYHQSVVKNVINEIRQNLGSRKTKILIGGNGLNQKPDIWRSLGADGYAPDAEKAVELANKLIQ
jgi:methanogenic corrinoid protein MtbC1